MLSVARRTSHLMHFTLLSEALELRTIMICFSCWLEWNLKNCPCPCLWENQWLILWKRVSPAATNLQGCFHWLGMMLVEGLFEHPAFREPNWIYHIDHVAKSTVCFNISMDQSTSKPSIPYFWGMNIHLPPSGAHHGTRVLTLGHASEIVVAVLRSWPNFGLGWLVERFGGPPLWKNNKRSKIINLSGGKWYAKACWQSFATNRLSKHTKWSLRNRHSKMLKATAVGSWMGSRRIQPAQDEFIIWDGGHQPVWSIIEHRFFSAQEKMTCSLEFSVCGDMDWCCAYIFRWKNGPLTG